MKTLTYLFFVLTFLVTGCSVNDSGLKDDNLSERGLSAVEYQILKTGEYACDGGAYLDANESILVFRSDHENDIKEFNREYALLCGEEMTFDGTVVIVRAGTKNSGGYSFEIDEIKKTDDLINISLNLVQKGSVVTLALTDPFIVLFLPQVYEDVNVTIKQEPIF